MRRSLSRRLLLSLLTLALVLLSAVSSFPAGSCTFKSVVDADSYQLTWECTADSNGDVSAPTITATSDSDDRVKYNHIFNGWMGQAVITPGTGDDVPTTLFDVELHPAVYVSTTFTENTAMDMLGGLGDNLSETATTFGFPLDEVNGGPIRVQNRGLVPFGDNMGAANKFTLEATVTK